MQSAAVIRAMGTYVPEQKLTNDDLAQMVETNDTWIVQRTGMKERRIAGDQEYASTLAIRAVTQMMTQYQVEVADVECILVATTTPDYVFPSVAAQIQHHFGIPHAGAMDLNATCAGFTYAIHVANGLLTSGLHRKILIVATETLSKLTDYTDRTTCILFGDGAAAMLLERDAHGAGHVLATTMGTDGSGGKHVYCTNYATKMFGEELQATRKLVQNGREVYRWASRTVAAGMRTLLTQADLRLDELDWFVPHSANMRMVESICEQAGFPVERTLTSMTYCGNTSSVSIPLALAYGMENGQLHAGDTVMLYGFGGGLTHCGHLIRWAL